MNIKEKILKTEDIMSNSLLERDEEIRLLLTSLLIKEHLLLIGVPGTAKSMLLNCLGNLCSGKTFDILLGKFTTPEELFGSLKLPQLEKGIYERDITNTLADSSFAFLDEIFKSSSAVLNMLLGVLNERKFKNNGIIKVPLHCAVAASNEWPSLDNDQRDCHALVDRFLIRKLVDQVKRRVSQKKLITLNDEDLIPKFDFSISFEELTQAYEEIKAIKPTKEFVETYIDLISKLKNSNIIVGDRRIRKSFKACQVSAWLDDSTEVKLEHGSILQHCMWTSIENAEPITVKDMVQASFKTKDVTLKTIILEFKEMQDVLKLEDMSSIIEFEKKSIEMVNKLKSKPSNIQTQNLIKDIQSKSKEARIKSLETAKDMPW